MNHTPGTWTACYGGGGRDVVVMCEDYPVAIVTSGEWGDEFPNIRLRPREDGMGSHAEAFTEMIVYGDVGKEIAKANARLVAAAPDLLDALMLYRIADVDMVYEEPELGKEVLERARIATVAVLAKVRGEDDCQPQRPE